MAANLAMALDEIIKQGMNPRSAGTKRAAGNARRGGIGSTSARTRFPQRGFVSGVV